MRSLIFSVFHRSGRVHSDGLSNLLKVTFLRPYIVFPTHDTVSVSETNDSLMEVMIIITVVYVID